MTTQVGFPLSGRQLAELISKLTQLQQLAGGAGGQLFTVSLDDALAALEERLDQNGIGGDLLRHYTLPLTPYLSEGHPDVPESIRAALVELAETGAVHAHDLSRREAQQWAQRIREQLLPASDAHKAAHIEAAATLVPDVPAGYRLVPVDASEHE